MEFNMLQEQVKNIFVNTMGIELKSLDLERPIESFELNISQQFVFLSALEDSFKLSLPEELLYSQTKLKGFAEYIAKHV